MIIRAFFAPDSSATPASPASVRPNVAGVRWSRYISAVMKGVTDLNLCANICQLPANATCHFYLLLNGTCYLGNVLATQSVIAKRSDAQNINVIASEQLRYWLL